MYTPMAEATHTWTPDRIKALRRRYGEKQDEFCKRFRVSMGALRIWEQGQGEPSGPVTVILDELERQLEDKPELQNAS